MAKTTTTDELRKATGHPEGTDTFEVLIGYLQLAKTRDDLRAALQAVAPAAAELGDEEREDLRERARTMLASFNNRVETSDLDGREVIVERARYLDTKFGGTYLLVGRFADSGQEFESWMPGSESGPVFRFYARRRKDDYPIRVIHTLEHTTRKDGEKGTLWRVERVPEQASGFNEIPF